MNPVKSAKELKQKLRVLQNLVFFFALTILLSQALNANTPIRCIDLLASHFSEIDYARRERIMQKFFGSTLGMNENSPRLYERPNDYFQRLWRSEQFKEYLRERQIDWRADETHDRKHELIAQFVDGILSRFDDPRYLATERDRVLRETLQQRGMNVEQYATGSEALAALSRANKQRFLRNFQNFRPHLTDAISAVDGIHMFLLHNSRSLRSMPDYGLVAPEVIEQIGLHGRSLNVRPLNRDLGSDQHVYFWVKFKRKTMTRIVNRSDYGSRGVIVNDAKTSTAFISPFIMYQSELHTAVRMVAPELANRFAAEHTYLEKGEVRWQHIPDQAPRAPEIIQELRRTLSALDFTFQDAEQMIKHILLYRLHEIYSQDREQYQSLIETLRNGELGNISALIENLVIKPLGFTSGLEGRIPVIAPSTDLTYFGD